MTLRTSVLAIFSLRLVRTDKRPLLTWNKIDFTGINRTISREHTNAERCKLTTRLAKSKERRDRKCF